MGVANWPTWEMEVSVFAWEFTTTETAFILEGECEMTPNDGGDATTFTVGDTGYKGTWEVKKEHGY